MHGDGEGVVENLQFLKEKLRKTTFMSKPFKLLQLHEKVVSIAFEEKLALDSVRLKLFLTHEFPI